MSEGLNMNDEVKLEKVIETIYFQILEGLPSEIGSRCPVAAMLSGLIGTMKQENNARIAIELGISSIGMNCPCDFGGNNEE